MSFGRSRQGLEVFISVIMAAFNAEHFVGEAIDSVLKQTHEEFELIVVDDGSTDRTGDVLRQFQELDPRVRVEFQENRGAGAARNRAVDVARSDWIAVMDSDDVMESNRLERQVAFVSEHPDVAIASCLVTWIDEHGQFLGRSGSPYTSDQAVRDAHARGEVLVFCHPGCLIRKEVIQRVGGYRPEFWPNEDLDLFSRVADAGGRILVQAEFLLRYRIHHGSGTGTTSGWDSTLFEWVRMCSLHRRNGTPEPTLEEFQRARRNESFFRRCNRKRRDLAGIFYRKATFTYSLGRRGTTVLLIIGSSLLDPTNAPLQVWQKYVRPRLYNDRAVSQ